MYRSLVVSLLLLCAKLNDTFTSYCTVFASQLGISRGLPCSSGCGDFRANSGGKGSGGDRSVRYSGGFFQVLLQGKLAVILVMAVGCVAVPPQTQNVPSYLFDFTCDCCPTRDNLRMKGEITLNSDRCHTGLFATMPSDSGKTSFLLRPGHVAHGVT